MKKKLDRRMFLKGSGGFLFPIPTLYSLLPKIAEAQAPTVRKRYFPIVGNYDYGHHQNWFPSLDQPSNLYTPSNGDVPIHYQRLTDYVSSSSDDLSLIFSNRFHPFLNKMNLLRGLNLHTRIGHGRGHILGNVRNTDGHDTTVVNLPAIRTIDQVLIDSANFNPGNRDAIWVKPRGNFAVSSGRQSNGGIVNRNGLAFNPLQLFNFIFQNGAYPESGSTPATPNPRLNLLTRIYEDYNRVSRGRRIDSYDKQVLESIMDRISTLQNSLSSSEVVGCSYRSQSPSEFNGQNPNGYNFTNASVYRAYARIFALAAQCDVSPVLGFAACIHENFRDKHNRLDFHQGHSHLPFTALAENSNIVNHRYMGMIWRDFANNFLSVLLGELDGITEANGKTILDNSIVHFSLECSILHSDTSKPAFLAGSAGGELTTGHYIDYSRRALGTATRAQGDGFSRDPNDSNFGHGYYGAHYNRKLTTILRAMGLNPSEYEDPNINTFFRNRSDGLLGAHNNGIGNIGGYGHIGAQNEGVFYFNSNQQMYDDEYKRYNYHFYKESLPFPPV